MRLTRTLDEAIAQGYVVIRDNHKLSSAFFRYCQGRDAPFVQAKLKLVFAEVAVDLMGQNHGMGQVARQEINHLLRKYNVGKAAAGMVGDNPIRAYAPRIQFEDVETVAKEIVAILGKPGYREPHQYVSTPLVEAVNAALRAGTLLPKHARVEG